MIQYDDRLCGLVIRFTVYKSKGLCSIPGATRFIKESVLKSLNIEEGVTMHIHSILTDAMHSYYTKLMGAVLWGINLGEIIHVLEVSIAFIFMVEDSV
jgi:hypothetical protein